MYTPDYIFTHHNLAAAQGNLADLDTAAVDSLAAEAVLGRLLAAEHIARFLKHEVKQGQLKALFLVLSPLVLICTVNTTKTK